MGRLSVELRDEKDPVAPKVKHFGYMAALHANIMAGAKVSIDTRRILLNVSKAA